VESFSALIQGKYKVFKEAVRLNLIGVLVDDVFEKLSTPMVFEPYVVLKPLCVHDEALELRPQILRFTSLLKNLMPPGKQ